MKAEFTGFCKKDALTLYRQAVSLAKIYCPEWQNILRKTIEEKNPDPDDLGDVLLKLFSILTGVVVEEINKIPQKYRLVFYDFLGMDYRPATAARAPLTFLLSSGSKEALVPVRTRVASSTDPDVFFETLEPLSAVNINLKAAYSFNPWNDRYTDHGAFLEKGMEDGFTIFEGRDPVRRQLCLKDDVFCLKNLSELKINIHFTTTVVQDRFRKYFGSCRNSAGISVVRALQPSAIIINPAQFDEGVSIDGIQERWLFISPENDSPILEDSDIPEITEITCTVATDPILPDAAFFNDVPIDVKKGFYPFGEAPKPGDAFYLGCKEIFSKTGMKVELVIDLDGGSAEGAPRLGWDYWDGCQWMAFLIGDGTGLNEVVDGTDNFKKSNQCLVSFPCPAIKETEINGIASYWIRVRLIGGNYGKPGRYLETGLDEIINKTPFPKYQIDKSLSGIKSEIVDRLKKELKPMISADKIDKYEDFFRVEKINEVFKIDKSLSGNNSVIVDRLKKELRPMISADKVDKYEDYFQVEKINEVFKPIKTISGIVSENYEELLKEYSAAIKNQLETKGVVSGYMYIPPLYDPPLIKTLTVKCSSQDKPITTRIIKNNFKDQEITSGNSFKPYTSLMKEMGITAPIFLIGYAEELKNQPVTLYFSLKSKLYNDTSIRLQNPGCLDQFTLSSKATGFKWQYFSGNAWVDLGVIDDTDFFTKNGIVKLIIPERISRSVSVDGNALFWLKVEPRDGAWFEPPVVKGIYPNTVWAENATIIEDELLGSSNGQVDQVFSMTEQSIIENPVIEVLELGKPTEADILYRPDDDGSEAVWVRWQEVKSFADFNPLGRFYRLDRINGRIIFGDGAHGMIPPAFSNNIMAREYKSGGGRKGNQQKRVITDLKTTIPNVEKVINYDSASGGRDTEEIDTLLVRAPRALSCGGRAVTREDFEWLAVEASPEVSKAKCVRDPSGKIKIIIAPSYDNGNLDPEASLTDCVETYLKERAFILLHDDDLEVVGPTYQKIKVEARISILPLFTAESPLVVEKIRRGLELFFNPIKGGPGGTGWNFGQDIFLSEVAAIIEDVEGVDFIESVSITKEGIPVISGAGEVTSETTGSAGEMRIIIEDHQLPYIGTINIGINGGN